MVPQKIYVFLKYLFDESRLRGAVRDDWLKIYDKEVGDDAMGWLVAGHGARSNGCAPTSACTRREIHLRA